MVQASERLSFVLEVLGELAPGVLCADHPERHDAARVVLLRFVDATHAACADLALEPVAPDAIRLGRIEVVVGWAARLGHGAGRSRLSECSARAVLALFQSRGAGARSTRA
jgi:hypothetical protein